MKKQVLYLAAKSRPALMVKQNLSCPASFSDFQGASVTVCRLWSRRLTQQPGLLRGASEQQALRPLPVDRTPITCDAVQTELAEPKNVEIASVARAQ